MKVCPKCLKEKSLNEFHKDKNRKDGVVPYCKECVKRYRALYHKNEDLIRKKAHKKIKEKELLLKVGLLKCTKCGKIRPLVLFVKRNSFKSGRNSHCKFCHYNIPDTEENVNRFLEMDNQKKKDAKLLKEGKGRCRHCQKIKLLNDFVQYEKEKYICICKQCNRIKSKKYYQEHPDHHNQYILNRRREDPSFKLKTIVSKQIREKLKSQNLSKKRKHIEKFLNYSIEDLKNHLEKLFNRKMDWKNYGSYWHIDHVIPQKLYNFKNDLEIKLCWNLRNLRPLEKSKNLHKQGKVDFGIIKEFNITDLLPNSKGYIYARRS